MFFTKYLEGMAGRNAVRSISMALMVSASWPSMIAWAKETNGSIAQSSQAKTISYNIPAGPLGVAISKFGAASDLQILYPADLVRDKETSGVSGPMPPQQALKQLLAKSGLDFRFAADNSITIFDPASIDGNPDVDGKTRTLDTIIVEGNRTRQADKDWIYNSATSSSVITREEIRAKQPRNISDIFDETAGTYASDEPQSPGVNVNLRGLQDQGRINMMIDGVRQTFQRSGHGSTAFVFVAPSMVRAVDIEKSTPSGVGGAASLGGAVNFRTLVADDIIRSGKDYGAELNLAHGTNEFDLDGSVSGAARINSNFSILASLSRKELGEYSIGKNGSLERFNGTPVISKSFTGSTETSGLLKAELFLNDDMTLEASWLGYQGEYSTGTTAFLQDQKLTNHTLGLQYDWQPDNPLIDLKAKIWVNRVKNEEYRQPRTTYDAFDVEYSMTSFGGSLENTSQFELPLGDLGVNYGFEAFHDSSDTGAVAADPTDDPGNLWFSGPNPVGKRDVVSGFSTASFEHGGWLKVIGGLRYDYYQLRGVSSIFAGTANILGPLTCVDFVGGPASGCTQAEYEANVAALIAGGLPPFIFPPWPAGRDPNGVFTQPVIGTEPRYDDIDVNTSGGSLLPALSLAVTPYKGVQFFSKYSHGYRPPTVMEAVLGGQHIGGIGDFGPNPYLEEETSHTLELGVNLSFDDLFHKDDSLRLKGVWFDRAISNYVMLGRVSIDTSLGPREYTGYVNLDGTTRMRGTELEAKYDAGVAYLGASVTHIKTDYADSYDLGGVPTSIGPEQLLIYAPPEIKFSVDAGLRLIQKTLTLGGRINHVGESELLGGVSSQVQSDAYTTFDLYASYLISENATLGVAINNVTDLAYVSALSGEASPAPGRTATLSLNVKF